MNRYNLTLSPPKNGFIGHRGVTALAPENTLAGFKLAASLGIDWVEFDIQLTSDNQLIIFHDETLERTTNGKGDIRLSSSEHLRELDAGGWFSEAFKKEKIPFFQEVIKDLVILPLTLNIELKTHKNLQGTEIQDFARLFSNTLKWSWPKERDLPLISSFHWPLLHQIRAEIPGVPIGFIHDEGTREKIDMVAELGNASLHCHYESLTSSLIHYANQARVPLLGYTVNDPHLAFKLLNEGLFALFTDNSELLQKL